MDGEIHFVRSRTSRTTKYDKEIYAIITPEMWNVIQRWGSPRLSPQTYIFKYARGTEDALEKIRLVRRIITKCNRRPKKIVQGVGVFQLTTYTVGHSFVTVLKRGGAKNSYISESLGRSNLSATEHYLAYFEKEGRIKSAQLLTNSNF